MKRQRKHNAGRWLLLRVLLALLMPGAAWAFTPPHAVGIALGGDMAVLPRGTQVVGWNPALLGLEDNPVRSFTLPVINMDLRMGNTSWSFNRMNEVFRDGEYIPRGTMEEVLADIEGEYLGIRMDSYMTSFAMTFPVRNFRMAVNLDAFSMTDIHIDRDVFELGMIGTTREDLGRTWDLSATQARTITAARAGVTIADDFNNRLNFVNDFAFLNELSVGASLYYYYGAAYSSTEDVSGSFMLDYTSSDIKGHVKTISTSDPGRDEEFGAGDITGGHGFGMDLGIAGKALNRRATFGLALTNLVGLIQFNDAKRRIYEVQSLNGLPLEGIDDTDRYWEENFASVDSLEESVSVTADLPTEVVLSGGYWVVSNLQVVGALRQGLDDAFRDVDRTRYSAGVEFLATPRLPLRTGMGFGGRHGFTFGLGAGYQVGAWRTDVGFAWQRGLFYDLHGLEFGLNMTFFFDQPESDPYKTKRYWRIKAAKMHDDFHVPAPSTMHIARPDELPVGPPPIEVKREKLRVKGESDYEPVQVDFTPVMQEEGTEEDETTSKDEEAENGTAGEGDTEKQDKSGDATGNTGSSEPEAPETEQNTSQGQGG